MHQLPTVAERLRAIRKASNHPTQAKFAEAINVSQATLSGWESGAGITHTYIIRICEATGVSADEFLGIDSKSLRKASRKKNR